MGLRPWGLEPRSRKSLLPKEVTVAFTTDPVKNPHESADLSAYAPGASAGQMTTNDVENNET